MVVVPDASLKSQPDAATGAVLKSYDESMTTATGRGPSASKRLAVIDNIIAMSPSPPGIRSIELSDCSMVQGVARESSVLHGTEGIGPQGGWRAWLDATR